MLERAALVVLLLTLPTGCNVADEEANAANAMNASDNSQNANSANAANAATNSENGVWAPPPGTTWQWQIDGESIDTSIDVAMYDVDLFDTPTATIDRLHDDGRIVVCYFSAGTYEEWRPDAEAFDTSELGAELPDWPGEFYLDIRSDGVRRIMEGRLDLAVAKGCDGVEPDNMDIYDDTTGFTLSASEQADYNIFIARAARQRGLSVGLKNALDLIPRLEPEFDWALNEECFDYDECDALRPFLDAGKAVFHTEYVDDPSLGVAKRDAVCGNVPSGFSTLIKTWDLDAWFLACD